MYCSLLRVPLAGEFTMSSFLLLLLHLPLSKSDKNHNLFLKTAFLFLFLFPLPNKQNAEELLGHSSFQAALSDKYNSHLVCGRALVLHSTLFFFHKLQNFLLSLAKILLTSNKLIQYVYIVLFYLEGPGECLQSVSTLHTYWEFYVFVLN